jgi:hypothetical protein
MFALQMAFGIIAVLWALSMFVATWIARRIWMKLDKIENSTSEIFTELSEKNHVLDKRISVIEMKGERCHG